MHHVTRTLITLNVWLRNCSYILSKQTELSVRLSVTAMQYDCCDVLKKRHSLTYISRESLSKFRFLYVHLYVLTLNIRYLSVSSVYEKCFHMA